jgi:hypothetical protein
MRNDALLQRVRVASLRELDALVGSRLTHEVPLTQWEDSRTEFLFPTLEEAIEAMEDPHVRQFAPEGSDTSVLTEVKEFRRYTSDLDAAWDVVDQLSDHADALQVHRRGTCWVAGFGDGPKVEARTAPLAICMAALLARGIVVDLDAGVEGGVRVMK